MQNIFCSGRITQDTESDRIHEPGVAIEELRHGCFIAALNAAQEEVVVAGWQHFAFAGKGTRERFRGIGARCDVAERKF